MNDDNEILWEDWKFTPVPAPDKKYNGSPVPEGTPDAEWAYDQEYLDDYAYELQQCQEEGLGMTAFVEWGALERFFGQRLNTLDYQGLIYYYNENCETSVNVAELGVAEPVIQPIRANSEAIWRRDGQPDQRVRVVRLMTSDETDLYELGPVFLVEYGEESAEEVPFNELISMDY